MVAAVIAKTEPKTQLIQPFDPGAPM